MRVSHSGRATQSRVCDLGFYRFLTPLALQSPLSVLNLPNGRDSRSTKKEVDSLNAFYLHLNLFMYFFFLFHCFPFFYSTAMLWEFYMPDTFVIWNETTENMMLPDVFIHTCCVL